jgi:hypothetical protein
MSPRQRYSFKLRDLNKTQLIEKCRELEIPIQDNWLKDRVFGQLKLITEAILDKLNLSDELPDNDSDNENE